VKLGKKHPDPVVETASLSSVAPTDVWYKLGLPEDTVTTGALSALQLEAVTYASQQHEHFLPDGSRGGFLIGESAVIPTIFIISLEVAFFMFRFLIRSEMCQTSFLW
jgi:hypothetical protein